MSAQTVLIVDDEAYITQSFARLFRKHPFRVLEAHNGNEALAVLAEHNADVVVSDQRMPGMTGAELFAEVQKRYPRIVRILLSGYTDFQALTYAINNGSISEFISKPWDNDELISSVERALKQAHEQSQRANYDDIFRNTSDGVMILDNSFQVIDANPAFQDLTGHALNSLRGTSLFTLYPELDQDLVKSRAQGEGWDDELWLLRKDRTLGLFQLSVRQLSSSEGYSVHCRDITESRRSELSSRHDLLTGLLNRTSFLKEIDYAINTDKYFSVLSIDLVRFRQVNESLGHEIGDELLCQIGQRLREGFSAADARNRIARVGGDEFTVLVYSRQQALDSMCALWQAQFKSPLNVSGHDLFIHLNIGISERSPQVPEDNAEQLFRQANTARHRASLHGMVAPLRYRADMLSGAKERMELHNDLHKVIPNNELLLLYQPKVDPKTNRTLSVEALVRWRHPEKGLINPSRFVALAEESGLIVDIGDWCINEAMRQLAEWKAHGVGNLGVAINLSPRQFGNPALVTMLSTLKERYRLKADNIELEITESTLLDDMDRAAETMNMIGELGFGFALDDFGTGYASFDYLQRFPFSTLKIDRSFIIGLNESEKAQNIVDSMIRMAHQLGQKVVAEGVEERAQAEILAKMQCDLIQGYLYSRPMPADLLLKRMLKEQSAAV